MERRTILLGSGTALATVFAGCSSTETADSEPDNSDDQSNATPESTDDTDGTAETEHEDTETETDTDGTTKDTQSTADDAAEDTHDGEETASDDGQAEIPGFDEEAVEDGDPAAITDVTRTGETVTVRAQTDTLDKDELTTDLESELRAFMDAIVDAEAFTAAVETVHWEITHTGRTVATFHIDTDWITAHANDELSEAELEERILETA